VESEAPGAEIIARRALPGVNREGGMGASGNAPPLVAPAKFTWPGHWEVTATWTASMAPRVAIDARSLWAHLDIVCCLLLRNDVRHVACDDEHNQRGGSIVGHFYPSFSVGKATVRAALCPCRAGKTRGSIVLS